MAFLKAPTVGPKTHPSPSRRAPHMGSRRQRQQALFNRISLLSRLTVALLSGTGRAPAGRNIIDGSTSAIGMPLLHGRLSASTRAQGEDETTVGNRSATTLTSMLKKLCNDLDV